MCVDSQGTASHFIDFSARDATSQTGSDLIWVLALFGVLVRNVVTFGRATNALFILVC